MEWIWITALTQRVLNSTLNSARPAPPFLHPKGRQIVTGKPSRAMQTSGIIQQKFALISCKTELGSFQLGVVHSTDSTGTYQQTTGNVIFPTSKSIVIFI